MEVQNIDNFVFQMAQSNFEKTDVPFLSKEIIFENDIENGEYSTSQVNFNTTSIANNGKVNDLKNGFFVFPICIQLTGKDGATTIDFTTKLYNDACIALKNSSNNWVHNIAVEYQNGSVLNARNYVNTYMNFVQNVSWNAEEEDMNGPFIGYAKDSSDSWGYNDKDAGTGGTEGYGLYNNSVGSTDRQDVFAGVSACMNKGLLKRAKLFQSKDTKGRDAVFGSKTVKGLNYIENTTTSKDYYYYGIIRAKDIPFLQNLPMSRGQIMKITFTLNINFKLDFTKLVDGEIKNVSFYNPNGLTNPLMITAHGVSTLKEDLTATELYKSGSFALPKGTYSVVAKLATLNNMKHPLPKCRMYMPSYTLSPEYSTQYYSDAIKTFSYNDIISSNFTVAGGADPTPFDTYINTGVAYAKSLVIVVALTGAANKGLHSWSSPFTTEPSTVSPFYISNFNVYVGNNPLYIRPLAYTYEQFMMEMNAQYGENSNMVQSIVGNNISLRDYNNNYRYIVCNLSRVLESDKSAMRSIRVSGIVESPLELQFNCFITVEKLFKIDIRDGTVPSV